jgi:hypothetical protein
MFRDSELERNICGKEMVEFKRRAGTVTPRITMFQVTQFQTYEPFIFRGGGGISLKRARNFLLAGMTAP